VVTYRDFLDSQFPLKERDEEFNKTQILNRNTLLYRFTKQGNPGSKFRSQAEKFNKASVISKNVKEELGVEE